MNNFYSYLASWSKLYNVCITTEKSSIESISLGMLSINLSNICFDEDFGVRLTDFKFGFGEGRKDEKYSEPKVSID